jgi:putative hemolysin
MDSDNLLTALTIALLLVISGIFSAAEIAFLSLGHRRARRLDRSRLGRIIEGMLEHPAITLSTILVAITAVNYSNEALSAKWVITRFGLPVWVAVAGLAVLVLVLAEAMPISYASANPERVARATVLPLWVANVVLFVPSRVLGFVADRLAYLFGGRPQPEPPVTEGEIRAIVDLQVAAGGLDEEEKVMIHSIFEFGDTVAREVMVPRTAMVAIPQTATVWEAAHTSTEHRISRLPVYRRDLDDIVGVVYVKDLLPLLAAQRRETPVTSVMKPPFIVPETRKLDDLLTDMRRFRKTLAIVVDEYGGTAGLVTLEDLLEEVVGDIWDEYDEVRPAVERVDENVLLLDGSVSLSEASEALGVALPEGEYDSLAGLLYSRLGVVEAPGESMTVEGVTLTVDQLDGLRIARVRAEIRPPAEDEEG